MVNPGLTNANWKVRLEAVQNFSAKVEGFDKSVNVQALIQLLGRKPGWKDNNAQVTYQTGAYSVDRFLTLAQNNILLFC